MEGQAQVRLVFAGELIEGHGLDDVKRRFGELFKLEGERLAAVFSGQRTVLKRSLLREDADRYVAKLHRIGMKVHVEPHDAAPSEAKAAPAAAAAAARPADPPTAMPSLVPLEEEVECPNCGERQPKKFVLCRKCTTDIPRAIEARREESDRARAERIAARQAGGRYAPPTAEVATEYDADPDAPPFWGFGFSGRMGRINYLLAGMCTFLFFALVGVMAAVLFPLTRSVLVLFLMVPVLLGVIAWALRSVVLRLHDVNRSGWWALIMLLPLFPMLTMTSGRAPSVSATVLYLIGSGINFLMALVLLIYPGTDGDNDFGGPPRRGNGLLAAIAALALVLLFAFYIGFAIKQYNEYVRRATERQGSAPRDDGGSGTPRAPAAVPPNQLQKLNEKLGGSDSAREAFLSEYLAAQPHKAFASSDSGAWAFSAAKSSPREAASAALGDCDAKRKSYTSPCKLVNVNGAWADER